MAESTLTLAYADLRIAAGWELRFAHPTDPTLWTTPQTDLVGRILKAALHRTYFPGVIEMPDGRKLTTFRWSFLKPVAEVYLWPEQEPTENVTVTTNSTTAFSATSGSTFYPSMVGKTILGYTNDSAMTLVGTIGVIASVSAAGVVALVSAVAIANATYRWGIAADGDYRLPDDFGHLNGPITLDDGVGDEVFEVNEGRIRVERQRSDSTGRPYLCALEPLRTDPTLTTQTGRQRFEMKTYPTPDDLYLASIPYTFLPDALTSTIVNHAGGMPYSEVFRRAVLAECESMAEDGGDGRRESEFRKALMDAVAFDLSKRPEFIGANEDPGVSRDRRVRAETVSEYEV